MIGWPIIDLVAGIIFIYFLLSIVCSSATELWFAFCGTRAKLLHQWLLRIFDSPALDSNGQPLTNASGIPLSLGMAIADHCMVTALSEKGKSTSYISPEDFVSALIDKVTLHPAADNVLQLPPNTLSACLTAIEKSPALSGELKRTILSYGYEALHAAAARKRLPASVNLSGDAGDLLTDMDQFRDKLEHWYSRTADRITGAMKRTKSMPATFILGAIITVGLNADSVSICRFLYDNKAESKAFADQALGTINQYKARVDAMRPAYGDSSHGATRDATVAASQLNKDIQAFEAALPPAFPMGWEVEMQQSHKNFLPTFAADYQQHLVGWLFTILAISLGAPFWFDLLNKVANVRGTGPRPQPANKQPGD